MQKEQDKASGVKTPKAKSAQHNKEKKQQHNAAGPVEQDDNVVNFTAPNWENYLTIPPLAAYLNRIAAERCLEIEQRNFKRFALYRPVGRYKRDYIVITIAADGTVRCPEDCAPTEEEAAGILAAWAKVTRPQSIPAMLAEAEQQRVALGVERANWFVMLDEARKDVVMCQQRIDQEDFKKAYLPWTLWSDHKWRCME